MISDYLKVRQLMAENGYEHTPAQAEKMVGKFNKAMEGLTTYESFLCFRDMDEEEIIANVEWLNKDKNEITLDEFKELREFILSVCEDRF